MSLPEREPDRRPGAGWQVVRTDQFRAWVSGLDAEDRRLVEGGLRLLAKAGPQLGRPRVDSIKGSRLHNLKELRLRGGARVLFAFDPGRRAVMLLGGNKTGQWDRWYRRQIPVAERLYAGHLRSIGKEDRCLERPQVHRTQKGRAL